MATDLKITVKQIYDVCCPGCKDKMLNFLAAEASKKALKDNLKQQLEKGKE